MAAGIITVLLIFMRFMAKNTTRSQLPRISRTSIRQMTRHKKRKEHEEARKVDDINLDVL